MFSQGAVEAELHPEHQSVVSKTWLQGSAHTGSEAFYLRWENVCLFVTQRHRALSSANPMCTVPTRSRSLPLRSHEDPKGLSPSEAFEPAGHDSGWPAGHSRRVNHPDGRSVCIFQKASDPRQGKGEARPTSQRGEKPLR